MAAASFVAETLSGSTLAAAGAAVSEGTRARVRRAVPAVARRRKSRRERRGDEAEFMRKRGRATKAARVALGARGRRRERSSEAAGDGEVEVAREADGDGAERATGEVTAIKKVDHVHAELPVLVFVADTGVEGEGRRDEDFLRAAGGEAALIVAGQAGRDAVLERVGGGHGDKGIRDGGNLVVVVIVGGNRGGEDAAPAPGL
eukprot:gene31137-41483_t